MNLTLLLLLAGLQAQDSVTPVVVPGGAIQAPSAPQRASSSSFSRGQRGAAGNLAGPSGRIKAPVQSLVGVRGQEDNLVWGLGLVDGLAGTGDSSALAKQMLRNMLLAKGINVDPGLLTTKNMAVVRVEATLPAGVKPGQAIDVRVSAYQDAKSLVGGNLMLTELFGLDDLVYATASGPVTVGGFTVDGEAASATKNHTTSGTLPRGGKVEREVRTTLVDDAGFLYLDARPGQDQLGNVVRIAEAINQRLKGAAKVTPDGKSVQVAVPQDLPSDQHGRYLYNLLAVEIVTENVARIVINERTGVVVMGGDVRLRPGAVAHGSMIVTIAETEEVSQPGPFSTGDTQAVDRTDLSVTEENNPLRMIPATVTLAEAVEVLNALGATPRDLISILTAMQEGGLLVAEIVRM